MPARRRLAIACSAALVLVLSAVGCTPSTGQSDGEQEAPPATSASDNDASITAALESELRQAMTDNDLRGMIVRVTRDGENLFTGAMGESLSGVPVSTDMHFRNGAFAFTYISQIVAALVDAGQLSLDDRIDAWLPDLPDADQVSIRMLLNMTSGYADYVYADGFAKAFYRDPFRQWDNTELIKIGMQAGRQFKPGSNWAYSHTNYVILGELLESVTGKPMAELMRTYVIEPMGLKNTGGNNDTPRIPAPVLHSFTSERRADLQVPADMPFTEDATYWNPSWTTASGAVQTTNITDITTSMEVVGSGSQVSQDMYQAQVGPNLVGFGAADPSGKCPACRKNTEAGSYGLGVVLLGPWITQTMNFAGLGATGGYLPDQGLAVAVATTYLPTAFDADGAYRNASMAIFGQIAETVSPGEGPPMPNG